MRLFCYGTLQFPAVLQEVTGGHFNAVTAVLHDYACYVVSRQVYPGIIAQSGAQTAGLVYAGIGDAHLKKLDRFEGDLYERIRVCVNDNAGNSLQAWTYGIAPQHRRQLTTIPWSRENFELHHLPQFIRSHHPSWQV